MSQHFINGYFVATGIYCVKCDSFFTSACSDVMTDDATLAFLVKCPGKTQTCKKVTQQGMSTI